MILDNVNDASFLLDYSSENLLERGASRGRRLMDYLPYSQNGSVLVTSRHRTEARRIVEESDIITVEPMQESDAIRLLQSKIGDASDPEELPKLAATLEFMPLALVQAASYIRQRGLLCSIKRYTELFSHNDENKRSLLNHEGEHLHRDAEAKNSIILAWQISFDYIRQTRPSAAQLLSLMSFCNRQGIPAALLRRNDKVMSQDESNTHRQRSAKSRTKRSRYYQAFKHKFIRRSATDLSHFTPDDHWLMSDPVQDDDFDQDILTLRDYAFVTVIDSTTFEMHDLVQFAIRIWLRVDQQYEKWNGLFIQNLCARFPDGEYENWQICQALYPHAKSALLRPPQAEGLLIQWTCILKNAACYLLRRGDHHEAGKICLKATETLKDLLGQHDQRILDSMLLLGDIYNGQGRWREAEKLLLKVSEARKKTSGTESRDALVCMNLLARNYRNQGRWQEAEDLHRKVLEARTKRLGADHQETMISINNLALLHQDYGRWRKAEELQIEVIKRLRETLGVEHPQTLACMNNLVQTYTNLERWKEAEELGMQVIKLCERELGETHCDTLASKSMLAFVYLYQERWEEAENLELQVLDLRKRELGERHPDTLVSMGNLASVYSNQGRWEEAEELELRALKLHKGEFGERHPDTLVLMDQPCYYLRIQRSQGQSC